MFYQRYVCMSMLMFNIRHLLHHVAIITIEWTIIKKTMPNIEASITLVKIYIYDSLIGDFNVTIYSRGLICRESHENQ